MFSGRANVRPFLLLRRFFGKTQNLAVRGGLDAARTFLDDEVSLWTTGSPDEEREEHNDAANHSDRGAGVELGRGGVRCGAEQSCGGSTGRWGGCGIGAGSEEADR